MARLLGMVHGVVVQIRTETGAPDRAFRLLHAGTYALPSGNALLLHRKLDVDRRRGVRLALDFRFGQRRAAVRTSARASCPCSHVLLDELAERPHDRRLVGERQRFVGLIPLAEHAEPLEVAPLWISTCFSA